MDLVEAIKSDKYDVIVINFANPDMVGHTGVIPAAIKAVERGRTGRRYSPGGEGYGWCSVYLCRSRKCREND